MTDPLIRRAINVLLAMRTLSEVAAHRYDGEYSNRTCESTVLVSFTTTGDVACPEPTLFEVHRDRINSATSKLDLETHVVAAEGALASARRRPDPALGRMDPEQTRQHVLLLFQDGVSPVQIAHDLDLSLTFVDAALKRG